MAINVKSPVFLRIDLNSGQVRKAVSVCKNDSFMRTLIISVVDSGAAFDLSTCVFAEILIKKADGFEADQGCVINGDTIEYTLTSNDVNALGTNLAQIMLTLTDGTVITSPPFEINVYSKILDQKVQKSQNEYGAITNQLALAKEQAEIATRHAADCANDLAVVEELTSENRTYSDSTSENALLASQSASSASASADSAKSSLTYVEESVATMDSKIEEASEYVALVDSKAKQILNAESHAQEYALSAEEAKADAVLSAISAQESQKSAELSAASASLSEDNASDSEATAKYYAEQAKAISESFSGALIPCGTVAFEDLPSLETASAGYMYNVSNQFVTTADFKEGAGAVIAAGSNVYVTVDKMWDVLAGSPVTSVRGSNETYGRRGDVVISAEDLGLAAVASTGNYSDLDGIPTEATETVSGLMSAADKTALDDHETRITALEALIDKLGYPLVP